jgi:hypothetical protein
MNTTRCAAGEAHLAGHHQHGHPLLGRRGQHAEDLVDHLRVEQGPGPIIGEL